MISWNGLRNYWCSCVAYIQYISEDFLLLFALRYVIQSYIRQSNGTKLCCKTKSLAYSLCEAFSSCCRLLRNPFISVIFPTSKTAWAARAKRFPSFQHWAAFSYNSYCELNKVVSFRIRVPYWKTQGSACNPLVLWGYFPRAGFLFPIRYLPPL